MSHTNTLTNRTEPPGNHHMDTTTSSGVAAGTDAQSSAVSRWMFDVSRGYQHLLDRWNPHVRNRWIASSLLAISFLVRVLYLQGFYLISYGLGIYLLILLIGFLSPKVNPDGEDAPTLPTRASDEFRPFVRRLPEFKFWYSFTKGFSVAFVLTFFDVFDVPVFWPILLIYWVFLFVLTMRRQILHMIKHKYLPFSLGKKTYGKTGAPSTESTSLLM